MQQDRFTKALKEFDLKIADNKDVQDDAIRTIKEDFMDRLDQIDKLYSISFNEMNSNIDSVKKMARERVEKKEDEL